MNISGAIFDLDGTLLDTTEIWEGVAARYITSLRKTPEPGLREKTKASGLKGSITLAGSTSVSPVMEVLADKYKELNSGVTIEIQQTGSGAGIQSTTEGVCDIGMASRELKDEETSQGLKSEEIALDGIAVIVNKDNGVEDLSMDQIMKIFTGEITNWADVK